jgi:hypothetical protein
MTEEYGVAASTPPSAYSREALRYPNARHPGESRGPEALQTWIPAFAHARQLKEFCQ